MIVVTRNYWKECYLHKYGWHFNHSLYEWAVSRMYSEVNGKKVYVTPYTKEETDALMAKYKITLNHDHLYDAAYVASMCRADFFGSSIVDEEHLAKYVKDVIDDVDAPEGYVLNRFLADCCLAGCSIDWKGMLE